MSYSLRYGVRERESLSRQRAVFFRTQLTSPLSDVVSASGIAGMSHFCEALQQNSWIIALNSSVAITTFFELCHYAGFFLLVGSIALVDLRVLGIAGRGQTATAMAEQLFPWMWTGLILATVSGFLMFAGDAIDFYHASLFQTKMVVLLAALLVGIIVQWQVPRWERRGPMSLGAKSVALLSLLLWIGTILAALEVAAINGVG